MAKAVDILVAMGKAKIKTVRVSRRTESRAAGKPPLRLWWIYLARCADGSLYCGIAKDVARRIGEHNSSHKAARYTRSRRPIMLAWAERSSSQSAALKREYVI